MNGRSDLLTDYSQWLKKNPNSKFKGFPSGVESIYSSSKYDTPLTTWAHTPGDKVTVMYTNYLMPEFGSKKYYYPFRELIYEEPAFKLPYDKHALNKPDLRSLMTFIDRVKNGGPLPQVVYLGESFAMHGSWEVHYTLIRAFVDSA